MNKQEWLNKCNYWKNKWPVPQEQGDKLNDDTSGLNIYRFIQELNKNLKEDSVIVSDAGSSLYSCGQGLQLNKNQRWICSWGQAEMGASLGMSVGVCFARNKKETIVVTGDGSLNTQIHALSIIRKFNLPIKIFILQNRGFLSIKNSQDKFFEGRRIGTDSTDGYFFPEIENIAKTYNIRYCKINKINSISNNSLAIGIPWILSWNEPFICEVICQEIQEISPGVTATKTPDGKLEQCDFSNLAPFMSEEEYNNEMIKD